MAHWRERLDSPSQQRWIGRMENALLVIAALVTAYLVYLALQK